jgi:hypothetical protein
MYTYILIHISGERVWSPQCGWTRTLLGACETCTTSLKRAQLLWNSHNCWETCTTSLKHAHIEYLKTLGGGGETRYSHIYIHKLAWGLPIFQISNPPKLFPYIYIYYNYIYNFPIQTSIYRGFPLPWMTSRQPPKSPCSFSKAAHGSTMQMKFCGTMPT